MDLFENALEHSIQEGAPLADRMRPRTLDEFVGQNHLLAPGRLLRRAIQGDQLSSLIFFGPPGTGKTTLLTERLLNLFFRSETLLAEALTYAARPVVEKDDALGTVRCEIALTNRAGNVTTTGDATVQLPRS